MNSKKLAIVFLQSEGSALRELADALQAELKNREVTDVCLLTQDDYGVQSALGEQVKAVLRALEDKQCIPASKQEEQVYSEEDEEKIKKRLEDLGYI